MIPGRFTSKKYIAGNAALFDSHWQAKPLPLDIPGVFYGRSARPPTALVTTTDYRALFRIRNMIKLRDAFGLQSVVNLSVQIPDGVPKNILIFISND